MADAFAASGRRCCTQTLHARSKPILHNRCDDSTVGGAFFTDVLPIPPLLSPPGPSVVTSPRAPRQFLECLGMFSWGRPGRSSRPPGPHTPSPPPMSLSPFQLQASPIHAGLFFTSVHLLPCPHATSYCVFPHLTRLSLSSAPAQLSSRAGRTHTRSHKLGLAHQQHDLVVGGTARRDRHDLFIVLLA